MTKKSFFITTLFSVIFLLVLTMGIVYIIDPYCHYRRPLKYLNYRLSNERYLNDGIIKNFDYDAIITGTSMTENFKSSQFDRIFGTKVIKIPFSGGSFKEINDNVEKALQLNNKIKYVLRGIDYGSILEQSDAMRYDVYPTYLYDNNIWNDYKYLLNKEVIVKGLGGVAYYTLRNIPTTNFDQYVSWRAVHKYGKEKVLSEYMRPKKKASISKLTSEEKEIMDRNIEYNVLRCPKEYPNVKFIYFITPYSVIYWDKLKQSGELEKQIEIEKYLIEKLLSQKNIELYSFFGNYDMVINLDNYKDITHYSGEISDKILDWIGEGKYRITKDNYKEYLKNNLEFYSNYDYDSIFEN